MVDIGNVWDRTSAFLSDSRGALLPIALGGLLVPQSINALVGGAGDAVGSLAGSAVMLITALITLWAQLAVVALALDPDRGRSGALAAATGSFGRAVLAMLVLLAVVTVLALPVVGVLFANGVDLAALGNGGMMKANLSGAAGGFLTLYMLVLVVVVLIVSIRTALLYPVIVAEGSAIAAIRRSFALSRGMVWKMIGVWLLFVIVYLVAAAAVTSAIGTVIGFFADMRGAFSAGKIIVAILSGGVSTLFTLIVAAFSAQLYRAAIAAREGVAAA